MKRLLKIGYYLHSYVVNKNLKDPHSRGALTTGPTAGGRGEPPRAASPLQGQLGAAGQQQASEGGSNTARL